ncbi:MAG: glycosyltransferase [Candidatus Marinimicrobia bacterium]|nr:glycosyltransferase [Candidatus Neomarinimicrobiota bacterium]
MKKPTISLCMIVRDEAETLRSAIECVKPFCDEIVIGIDSRSSDESESIASEYADLLYKFKWNGSFSDARNQSISKCTKEWLLIWDAHEFMSAENVEKIREKMWSVVAESCPAIGFKLIMEDGAVGMQTRLMKNGIGWEYSGKVHNQLNSSQIDPKGNSMGFRDIVIEHRPTKSNRKRRKKERYAQISRDMGSVLKKNPKDIRSAFYLASIAHERGNYKKAIRLYQKYLKNSKDATDGVERYLVTWQMGRCRMALDEPMKAKQIFHDCLIMRNEIPLAYVSLGEIAAKEARGIEENLPDNAAGKEDDRLNRKWSEAEEQYKQAIALAEDNPMPDSTVFYPGAFYSWLPVWNLGKLYEMNAMYDQALYCVLRAARFEDFPKDMKSNCDQAVKTLREIIKDQLTATDEQVSKLTTVHPGKPKLVIFDSIGSFTKDIANELDGDYSVVVSNEFNPSLAWWGDLLWFDWCDNNLAEATRMTGWEQRIICRVHGYEAYESSAPEQVNWENVDDIVFVAEHTKNAFLEKFPAAEKSNHHIIANGIDLFKWEYKERSHGKRLGSAGYLKQGKNPSMLLQILYLLPEDYTLKIAGEWQSIKEKKYFIHLMNRFGIANRVTLEPWQDDMNNWLNTIDYLISPSISESFSYIIGEAMAKGIKPVVIDRPGAEDLWGEEFLFRTTEEAVEMILPKSDYDSEAYRKIAERYSLDKQLNQIRKLLKGRKTKKEAA